MPHKNPAARRWGGPGASHEDRREPPPPERDARNPGEPTNTPHSHVSGGGGERDRHHAHDARGKKDFEENSRQRSKP